ncbi:hypothetical protein ACP70R_042994 [Stipagrostis hirtigluma subsp. patula]
MCTTSSIVCQSGQELKSHCFVTKIPRLLSPMAGGRLRLRSMTQLILVLSLLMLLPPPLHSARLAGDEPRTLENVKPEAPSTGMEEGEGHGHRLAPAKAARPLRILAEPVPARRKARRGMGTMELPSPQDATSRGKEIAAAQQMNCGAIQSDTHQQVRNPCRHQSMERLVLLVVKTRKLA